MRIGIVGHEAAKFTQAGEARARSLIRYLLETSKATTMVSGGCHLGGIDIWAEEEAAAMGIPCLVHRPEVLEWHRGYKPRNMLIARDSDVVHCLVVDRLPPDWTGMTFQSCYHCGTTDHVKSGGCWTAKRAKRAHWHVIPNGP